MKEFGTFADFFAVMALTRRQKKEREKAAEDFETLLIIYLLLIAEQNRQGYREYSFAKNQFITDYSEMLAGYTHDIQFISSHVPDLAEQLLEATLENIDDEYYTSVDRAMTIAANESLNVLNKTDFDSAIELGFRKKKWLTQKDMRVRPTHSEVDDKVIPITDVYIVGDSVMRFPHDLMFGPDPKEIVNCRCAIEYMR